MKHTLSITLLIIFVFAFSRTQGQIFEDIINSEPQVNYVPNPGFEITSREYCKWNQSGREYMEAIAHWDSPTESTPDLLSIRVKPSCWANPRHHSGGEQSPHFGDNMMGIKTYGKGGTDTFWHEYLSVKLDSTLVPGQKYYAEFYVSRAVKSDKASNNIGMYFSDTAIVTRDRMPLFYTPQVNAEKVVKSRWNFWKKINGVFEVDSEKNYLLIGNFYNDNVTKTDYFPEGQGGAYYYIDDVLVRRAEPGEFLTPEPKRSISPRPKRIMKKAEILTTKEIKLDSIDYRVGNTISLENIFFEFDKAVILPESEPELEKLIDILTDYPYMTIQISGHTDNIGTDAYNQKLSEARAKSVVEYLINEDVNPERLSFKGYGSHQPMASNDTDAGRSINRRVEFTVIRN